MAKYMTYRCMDMGQDVHFSDTLEEAKKYGTEKIYLVSEIFTRERLDPVYEWKETKL